MLGVCLLFVGIVLINNGMCSLYNVDGKSTAIMNIGVLPVKRTMKNNNFFSVSLLTGWRYFYAAFNVSS